MGSLGQMAREHWAVVFAGAVLLFLAITQLDLGVNVPSLSGARNNDANAVSPTTADTAASEAAAVAAGSLSFGVTGLRIVEADGTSQARVTLDIENTSDDLVRFQPQQMQLSRNGGAAVGPSDDHTFAMLISPHVSQLVPLTFSVNATPGATYELVYAGKTVYSGVPR